MADPRPFDVPRYLSVLPLFTDIGPVALRRVAEFAGLAVPGDNAEVTIDPAKAAEAEQRAREAEAERERDSEKRRRRAVQAAQRTWSRAVGNRDHEHVRR